MTANEEQTITDAVLCAVSPIASPQLRQEAYQVLEKFKAAAPQHSHLLFMLLDVGRDDRVRHYALLILEHIIKHCWNDIPIDSKYRLKTVCMSLIQQATSGEPMFISEGVAKCIVEIAKREWPQQWPTFIDEMSDICIQGETRKGDLVMRILLRLAEDIVTLNTIPAQRRKDMQGALNEAVVTIVPFLIQTLEMNIAAYKKADELAREHLLNMTTSTLQTIMGYVSWCDACLVNCHDNKLVTLLFQNLNDAGIQLLCVECLMVIAQRHGNTESISPVLVMFYEGCLLSLQQAGASPNPQDPRNHNFLKRLCQFSISMGEQLCALWAKEGITFALPPSFPQYLNILLTFTGHESLFITAACFEFWPALIRIGKEQEFVHSVAPRLAPLCLKKLEKIGAPSDSSHRLSGATHYAKLDFDAESDWMEQFHKTKSAIFTLIHLLSSSSEQLFIDMSMTKVTQLLDVSEQTFSSKESNAAVCDPKSALYLEWEAVNAFLHACAKDMKKLDYGNCISLYQRLLTTPIQEPQILGIVLSIISALFPILPQLEMATFDLLLERVFSHIQYSHTAPAYTPAMSKNLARHAGAVFIKLALLHPVMLIAKFNVLHDYVVRNKTSIDCRTYRCLMEGVLIISNEMKSYNGQVHYIGIALEEPLRRWSNEELQQSFQSPKAMAQYIGLLPCANSTPDIHRERRFQLQELLRDFLMVTRRIITPSDPKIAADGGYVNLEGVVQSPSGAVLMPHLDLVLRCLDSLLGLYHTEVYSQFHPTFSASTIHGLPQGEKTLIIGLPQTEQNKMELTEHHYLQKHVLEVLDSINQLLMSLAKLSAQQFYRFPNLAGRISGILNSHLQQVNSLALKNLMKSLVKPLCLNCPAEMTATFVCPILSWSLAPLINTLDVRWKRVEQRSGGSNGNRDDCDMEDEEIIEDELLRMASRELLDLCVVLFIENPQQRSKQLKSLESTDVEMADTMTPAIAPTTAAGGSNDPQITEFVKTLPQDDVLYLYWLSTNCSCWRDTLTAQKSVDMVMPLTRYLNACQALTSEVTEQVLRAMLTAVHIHGQHDTLSAKIFTCILGIYELMKPKFACSVIGTMIQVPGVTQAKLEQFERDISINSRSAKPCSAKKKRDKLKALISEIVGKNISEQFSEHIVIKNLPPLVTKKLRRSDVISASSDSQSVGLCQLFTPS